MVGTSTIDLDVIEDSGNNFQEESTDDDHHRQKQQRQHDEEDAPSEAVRRKLRRHDSLDIESAKLPTSRVTSKGGSWWVIMQLAFQSLGVVYGDIGTSPLYVLASTFPDGINHRDDLIGILSIILYTITLLTLLKYVFIVLQANDNGDGGTFALYSLICRYAKVGLIPSVQAEDREVSNYELELPNNKLRRATTLKSMLENSPFAKYFLLFVTLLGTSMVIGDGILTPCISVLSAVNGIKYAASSITEGKIVWISVAILVFLFSIQRFGTDKVGYSFAPIILVWFMMIGCIGLYNFIKFDPIVIKALNPQYIIEYFKRNKKQAWISLGGTILSITGTEAMFADLGHFSVRSIQVSMCIVTYPAIVLAYIGQASYLHQHLDDVSDAFYKSIPGPLYWPMFVVAVLASIIASQAMISGAFSIIQQSLSLGCFPRVKIVHTSTKYEGQVYIPEVNYLLMLACVGVTVGFKTTVKIGNAYGIAVVFVMALTSWFLVLIMTMIWKTNIILIMAYVLVICSIELVYLSSVLYKFDQGGYLPLAFALFLVAIMYIWNDVYRKKYYYELNHKISREKLKELVANTSLCRMPGLAIFYSELVHGIPPIFKHYMENVPALHSVLVFVSIKSLPVSKVPMEERFFFRQLDPSNLNMFRCVVRYGYTDVQNEKQPFEILLVERLKEFVRDKALMLPRAGDDGDNIGKNEELDDRLFNDDNVKELVTQSKDEKRQQMSSKEIFEVENASKAGIIHLIGESEVIASKGARMGKRIVINYAYNFLKRNIRQTEKVFDIPHKRMLKVGVTYEL
ncbi:potassium transporter 5-like isoform X2 [Malania oleifera]|uniref:potassium transporter 5-like isoform X2 n=1 Tax=Malania oleifera TaxID=397392 RepID=UPI0025AE6D4F|nr:potassium transporter 5-like isoform X2 [Malania oleifera]